LTLPRRGHFFAAQSAKRRRTSIVESCMFLAGKFSRCAPKPIATGLRPHCQQGANFVSRPVWFRLCRVRGAVFGHGLGIRQRTTSTSASQKDGPSTATAATGSGSSAGYGKTTRPVTAVSVVEDRHLATRHTVQTPVPIRCAACPPRTS
jgi:hypothetical protein